MEQEGAATVSCWMKRCRVYITNSNRLFLLCLAVVWKSTRAVVGLAQGLMDDAFIRTNLFGCTVNMNTSSYF